ncbi:MAG: hypothetical protein RIA09_05935 [Hoeflea sp.]|uniref:hypothetical protein n=1 Tax=Hoeflea sp. TaxID=1940281 RepID=UPI0032ECB97B
MEILQAGNQAVDLQRILRQVGHNTPNDRTIARICYAGQLMKSGMAFSMLRAFRKYADEEGLAYDADTLSPSGALVEFNYEVQGLAGSLAQATGGLLNADVDPVADIASHMGTTPEAVLQAVKGRCVLTPYEFANNLSIAASQVLKRPSPFTIMACLENETARKPIGGNGLEQGKPPHACSETARIRSAVLESLASAQLAA